MASVYCHMNHCRSTFAWPKPASRRKVSLLVFMAKARLADHGGEGLLLGKAADRFDEILVTLAVARHRLPHAGDHVEGIEVVEPAQAGIGHAAEFEHEEPPARA